MNTHIHSHPAQYGARATLLRALALTLAFALVEAVGGWWSGSLALLGDAGHMVTDSLALGLAALAAWAAMLPPTRRQSYGWGRVEVVAAIVNSLLMMAVVLGIVIVAIQRIQAPRPVMGEAVMVIAALGLIVNLLVLLVLRRGEQTLNSRGAMLHVVGDLLGSVAAFLAGLVIALTGWTPIDPLLSLVICLLIGISSVRLLREGLNVILEGVPPQISLPVVKQEMRAVSGVRALHDLHIWTLSSGVIALSAHITVYELADWDNVLAQLCEMLDRRFSIQHVTLQPEGRMLEELEDGGQKSA